MQWFDWMSLAIVLGMAIIQTIRTSKAGGMGLALFEMAGLIVSAFAANTITNSLASAPGSPRLILLLVLFIIFAILAFFFARWLFTVTGWSFESLDGLLGFLWGFAAGWVIAHMVLRIIVELQGPNGAVALGLADAPIAREIYFFRTWNGLIHFLFKVRLGPEFNPDVG